MSTRHEDRVLGRFYLHGEDGSRIVGVAWRRFVIFTPLAGSETETEGTFWFTTEDGEALNALDQAMTQFELVQTGQVYRRQDV